MEIFRIQVQMLIEPILRSISTDGRNKIVHDCGSFRTLKFAFPPGDVTRMYGVGEKWQLKNSQYVRSLKHKQAIKESSHGRQKRQEGQG